jgi:hypothetical protein
MSRHLGLFLNYAAISRANFSSQDATPAALLGTGEQPTRTEIAEPVFSAILYKSWIESYPATQLRFARIAVAGRSSSAFI